DDTLLFNIDPETGRVSFTPSEIDVGEWPVEVTVWDGTHQTKTQFIITVEPQGDDESILGFIPLTTVQLLGLLVLVILVVVAGWAIARSRRREGPVGESGDEGPAGQRGETT
ncbi:MAG: hypothetical protein JSW25_06875, partial [Thermoplasmata archaeon]